MKRDESTDPSMSPQVAHTSARAKAREWSRGFYTTILALWLPLFIGFMGLGVDMSHFWWVRGQLQNAADAAAFAGARELNSTAVGRIAATGTAATYATEHSVNGTTVSNADLTRDETGAWDLETGTFSTENVSDAAANAISVTVTRENVPTFFTRILSGALTAQTVTASAIALAGGAGAVSCGFPTALASCVLHYSTEGALICPINLSFQNGPLSIGLTHPDGTDPISGHNTIPYFQNALADTLGCNQGVAVGAEINLQNGNDLAQKTVNDINTATKNGTEPLPIILPVVDTSCDNSGPIYNGPAQVVGFLKMKLVGARWIDAPPAAVAAACPTLGTKNICVAADCSLIEHTPGGGTIQSAAERIYLVR